MSARARYEVVADDLAEKIRTGHYPPGSKLPSTRELIEEYGISETVLRFAMVHLRALRLVEGQQGRGVYVRPAPLD